MRFPRMLFASTVSIALLAPAPLPAAEAPQSANAVKPPAREFTETTEQSILDWIRKQAHPLPAGDPAPDDLAALVDALGTPRVIGIGEITHGTHEDLALKSALILALLQRGDIDCLVFELNRRTGERLQRFVAPGSTELDAVAAMKEANVYGVWQTREVAGLLDAVRKWNATAARPVRVVGVDVQDVSHDLDDALQRLKAIDPVAEQRLRPRLSDWLDETAMGQHMAVTIAGLDRARWTEAMQAARELESALQGKDAAGHDAAQAAREGLWMLEYHVKGGASKLANVPPEVWSRRDMAMANRLVASVPDGQRAVLWAHDMHVARQDVPYGFGFTSVGSQLHHLLGRNDYRTVTFSARRIDFHAKGLVRDPKTDRNNPVAVWRYESGPDDFGTFLSRAGMPRYWVDLNALPTNEAGGTFRGLVYGRPAFGWGLLPYPVLPQPVGYGTDVLVHFEVMTPSRRLEQGT